jgi:hypothetical protein
MNAISASSGPIDVLVADSSQMQSQLLVAALRRRPEFHVISCNMDAAAVPETITARRPRVALITTDHHNGGWQDMRPCAVSILRIPRSR